MADPKSPTPEGPVLETDELEWELFWHRHKTKILGGAAALILIGLAIGGWYLSSSATDAAARKMLAEANDAAAWSAVIEKYPRSMPAADAYFRLADVQRTNGTLQESTATFRKFLDVFPNHPLAGGALFGVGQNLDAEGKAEEAMAAYREVIERYPKSYAAPFAAYSEAEIFLRDFRREEARRVLEALQSAHPDSTVARLAGAQLERLEKLAPTP